MITNSETDRLFDKPKEGLTLEDFKEDICLYIRRYDWVSVAELKRRYDKEGDGTHALTLDRHPNVLVYANLSELLTQALIELLKGGQIHAHPAHALTYMIDGGLMQLPLAKRISEQDYRKPHWLPLCFRNGPGCAVKGCLGKKIGQG